jgi:NDP-sugar pyrophosphorylase family protein
MSGIGKRFIDAGYSDPKPLIEVDGKPMIEHVLNLFPGVTDVLFICNHHHLQNTDMYKILRKLSPDCKILGIDEHKLGPVYAVLQGINYYHFDDDKETIISYCDYGTVWDFEKFLKQSTSFDGSIACYKGFHPHMLNGNNYAFVREHNLNLLEIQEKKSFTDDKMAEFSSNGTYYFKSGRILKKYFQELIDKNLHVNGEFYVSMVYNLMVKDKLKVSIFEIEKMLQWGIPEDLESYVGWSNYFRNIINDTGVVVNDLYCTTILPMAGHGSRFKSRGYILPKPLINVNGKPMVVQAVKCLPQSNKNIFIALKNRESEELKSSLELNFKNVSILYLDKTTEGQAQTCSKAITELKVSLDDPILISACDNGVYYDKKKYLKLLSEKDIDVIVWSFRNNQTTKNNPNMYSWLKVDEDNNVLEVSCKNLKYGDPLNTHAIIGTMYFKRAEMFLSAYHKNLVNDIRTNNEFYVDDVLNVCIEKGLKVKVFEVENYICWGTPDDLETYLYWQDFFHNCTWHPYRIENDITYGEK